MVGSFVRLMLCCCCGREDLIDRGVLEASELKMAFLHLDEEKGGSITTVQDLLKWNIIDSAIKEGVVSFTVSFAFVGVSTVGYSSILRQKLGIWFFDRRSG